MVMTLVIVGRRRWRARTVHLWHGLAAGGLTALTQVGLLDHYLWSVPQGALLGAWLVGWWLTDVPEGCRDGGVRTDATGRGDPETCRQAWASGSVL
jgi:hypothetical protein